MSRDQLMLDVDQAGELKAMFRREGWTNKAIKMLCEKKGLGALFLDVLEGRAEIKPFEFPEIDLDADPFIPEGWSVAKDLKGELYHKKGGKWKYDPTKVGLYLSKRQYGSSVINGHDLRKELESQSVMNANLLDFYFKNTHLIPSEWKGKIIYFWGTIYRNNRGNLCVRTLYWRGDQWCCDRDQLDCDWPSDCPAVVLIK